MIVYIIISLFAFYGIFHLIQDITVRLKASSGTCCGKLCLIPRPGDECLESKIRCIFLDEVSERLGTDGCLYVKLEDDDPNKTVVERLAYEYPRLILLEDRNWSRMDMKREHCDMAGDE